MRCIYCGKSVFGSDGITVPNEGPAHQACYQATQALKRTFQSLDITTLNDGELTDLLDLVLAEINSRKKGSDTDDIELF
jgi:hypothetical protein